MSECRYDTSSTMSKPRTKQLTLLTAFQQSSKNTEIDKTGHCVSFEEATDLSLATANDGDSQLVSQEEPSGSLQDACVGSSFEVETMTFEILRKPNQPRCHAFPKKRFGQKSPEYRGASKQHGLMTRDGPSGFTGRTKPAKCIASFVEMYTYEPVNHVQKC